MNDVVAASTMRVGGVSIPLDSQMGESIVKDAARFNEGSLSEDEFRSHWALSDAEWEAIASNVDLIEAVRVEMRRRVESGEAARDHARFAYPEVVRGLVTLANSAVVSARHRIDAARELRAISGVVKEDAAPLIVSITINKGGGGEPLHYDGERPRTPIIDLTPLEDDDIALEQDDAGSLRR
jgi:hypothetical protein